MTVSQHIRSVRAVLSSYLPNYLVQSISQNPEPGVVRGDFHHGAVLFADVSGFTAMSEMLTAIGKEGAEEITEIVNNYFTAMLAVNDRIGGDLLKFGGDALLIFFDGENGPSKALITGKEMMAAMENFSQVRTSQGVFPLRMKIGIAAGPVFLARLGTPESMDHVVMGTTLNNMAKAEQYATAGEIIVHKSVCDATSDSARFSPLREDFYKLEELVSSDTAAKVNPTEPLLPGLAFENDALFQNLLAETEIIDGLRPFVPEELFMRIVHDPQRIVAYGSHRPVTVSFTNVLGFNQIIEILGPDNKDQLVFLLNQYYVTMGDVIRCFGGTVNRLDVYSVGYRILGLFGALQAHSDDPLRAVRAALEMNKALADLNRSAQEILSKLPEFSVSTDSPPIKQRVGINTGFVFGSNTGSETRREYTVMGDQVNLTARIMGVAREGEVLISHSTSRQTDAFLNLLEGEAVRLKGKTAPVKNFAVRGLKQQAQWQTTENTRPIIGREQELAYGREAIDQTINGEAKVVVVSGDSGLGKTRLAEELVGYGRHHGMELIVGTCLSYGSTMTYHPWAEVLRAVFGILTDERDTDSSARIEAVQRGMQMVDEEVWAPVIGAVLGLEFPESDLTRNLDPQLRRQRILDLTVKLLINKAKSQPLFLIIEDAHWADPASMDLINYIARNIAGYPILFMLLHRPDIDLPDWSASPHAVGINLNQLSDMDCKEIIDGMLGGLTLTKSMYELILSKSSGNPFFLGEVVRALIDAGALERDASGEFHVTTDISRIELPDTIHGVILNRIDHLQDPDRRILQVASVIGRVFAYHLLNGVYPYTGLAHSLRERLAYLNEHGLTEIQSLESELYRFIHLTTREVVYEGLPFKQRRSLHREIGDYIEEVSGQSIGEKTSLLAYHYYEGQAWDQALMFNLTAARNAQREFANNTAILAAERALEAADNLSSTMDTAQEQISAHELIGEVMTLIGQYDEALRHLELARQAIEQETANGDIPHLVEICRKTAAVYERLSEYETAFEWLERGLQYLNQREVTIEATRIYLLGTGIFRRLGKMDDAVNWCQKSLDLASQIQTYEGRQAVGQAYYNLGGIEIRRGDLQKAVKYCLQSLEVYEQIEDAVGQARAHTNLGAAYNLLGNWVMAVQSYNLSLAINQQIGDIQREGFLANNLANIHLNRGEWDQAAKLLTQSNEIWKRIGSPLPEAVTLSNLAQVNIYQENWDLARENLSQSQMIFEEIGSKDFMPELKRRWGEFWLKRGKLDLALENIRQSIELAIEQDSKLEWGMSMRVLGEIKLAMGEHDAAGESLNHSLELLTEVDSEYEAAKTILSIVRLAMQTGREVDRDLLDQAARTFKELEAQADLSQARQLQEKL